MEYRTASKGQSVTQPENRIPLSTDEEQWLLDLAIQQTGQVQHFWEARRLPVSVKTHAMISKQLGKNAQKLERLARSEDVAGHGLTALDFYWEAAKAYSAAQHTILVTNAEKRFLLGSAVRCYDRVRQLSPNRIEKLEIPWEGGTLSGYLHLASSEPAPLVFFLTGIDMTKEVVPDPLRNWAALRGMHLFVFEGPGQGEANLRGLRLGLDNYERAASAALDVLVDRPEIDAARVGLYAMSFGSYWGARLAGTDRRFAAVVLQWASLSDMNFLFGGSASPRYKQVLAYVTGVGSEEELNEFIDRMDSSAFAPQIEAPTLITVGEFDQRNRLDEIYRFYDTMTVERELWVFADQHHRLSVKGSAGHQTADVDTHLFGMDWLQDRLHGKPLAQSSGVKYLEGIGPNDPRVAERRQWFDA
jgi:pimeloyl-ACP methyl ester carboxylesterase